MEELVRLCRFALVPVVVVEEEDRAHQGLRREHQGISGSPYLVFEAKCQQ